MNEPNANLSEVMARAERRYVSDGIPEMVMGALWVLWGAILMGPLIMPDATRGGIAAVACSAALVASALAAQPLMRHAKVRFTASRTGYIEPRRPSTGRNTLALTAGLAISVLIPLALLKGGLDEKTLFAPAVGGVLACGFAIGQVRRRTPSGWLYAAVCAAAGLVLAILRVPFEWGLSLLFIVLGAASICAGRWRFVRFVRAHPEERHG